MTEPLRHIPVMLDEAVEGLAVRTDGRYLDGTFGRGGHARAVLSRLGPAGRLLLMDRDPAAVASARQAFADEPRVAIQHANYAELAAWHETASGLNGVLLDLGVSSPQLDQASRGFSFMVDAPLDMRMDPSRGLSAADFLLQADEAVIAEVLWRYGEERHNRRIARAIIARRKTRPVQRTLELAHLIEATVGRRESGKHPATRSFQALRIEVNAELQSLRQGLAAALERLKLGGRLAVISFHSLEDREVKQFIRGHEGRIQGGRRLPPQPTGMARLRAVGKAQFPGAAELAVNPRARSAVLRVAEKLTVEAAA